MWDRSEDGVFDVQRILSYRKKDGWTEYLCKWESWYEEKKKNISNYGDTLTWIDERSFSDYSDEGTKYMTNVEHYWLMWKMITFVGLPYKYCF